MQFGTGQGFQHFGLGSGCSAELGDDNPGGQVGESNTFGLLQSHSQFHDTIHREYSGVSGRIGLLAHVGEYVSLGLTATAPIKLEVDELWRQETTNVLDNDETESDSNQGRTPLFDIERPFELGAGIAVKMLEERLMLGGDVQFTDWTQTAYSSPPSEDASRDNFEQFYDSTVQIRIGAEYRIKKIDTYTRVGYFRDPIPFNGKQIHADRHFITIGVGKVFGEVIKFDIAYMRGSWKKSSESLTTARISNRVFFSTAYRH